MTTDQVVAILRLVADLYVQLNAAQDRAASLRAVVEEQAERLAALLEQADEADEAEADAGAPDAGAPLQA